MESNGFVSPTNGHSQSNGLNGNDTNGHGLPNPDINGNATSNGGSTTHGHATNGHTTNEHTTNGHTTNEHANNGHTTGHTTNGHTNGNGTANVNGATKSNGHEQDTGVEPIAIVGMATRLPGGVHDTESFWDLLINKKNARCGVPATRWNNSAYYNPHKKTETMVVNSGYFLEELDLSDFDAGFFNLSKTELERLDPQQRLLLEVTWECLESAGQKNWRGKNIGCYVGTFGEDWLDISSRDPQETGLYRLTGHGDYVLPNRVSYEFDFKGPR